MTTQAKLKNCIKLISLTFRILEEREDAYYAVEKHLNNLKKKQGKITPNDLVSSTTIQKLSEFLSSWNKSRRYNKASLKNALKLYLASNANLILNGRDIKFLLQYKSNSRRNNEKIGTVKICHIINPHEYPLIDNPIAEKIWGKSISSMKEDMFIELYSKFRNCIKSFAKQKQLTLKQLDELLYILYTKQKRQELYELFRTCGNNKCKNIIEKLEEELCNTVKKCLS